MEPAMPDESNSTIGFELPPTLAVAAASLRSGEITSVALVETCLQRIERAEPEIHACVTVMTDIALEQARAVDAQRAAGAPLGPLAGIPVGIKDLVQTRGVRTTAGSRVLADWVPEADATVVTRLVHAGAISICKTNTHEFAYGWVTWGTANPWDLERVPGGSSGGSAAAVATGECLGALGTDTGGSIRIPAAACGVTGLMPTFGLVSRAGIIPLSWSLDHAGPIARTVEDCALLLDALAGYDPADLDSLDLPVPAYAAIIADAPPPDMSVHGLRIGVPASYFFRNVDSEVEHAVRSAIGLFERQGATLVEVEIPASIDDMFQVYRGVQRPEAYTYHRDQGWLDTRAELYRPDVLEVLLAGERYSARDYIHARQAMRAFAQEMRRLLETIDVLMTPTLPSPARRIAEVDTPILYNGRAEPAGDALRYTFPFDLTGQPALTVPCGFTSDGLPVGLQIVAPHLHESALLRIGHAYQQMTDWHLRVPPVVEQRPDQHS
jgi:aspartyl-tRNA(Asn)/glutamyl-tRNA(Gln) amidotransferase subunit A